MRRMQERNYFIYHHDRMHRRKRLSHVSVTPVKLTPVISETSIFDTCHDHVTKMSDASLRVCGEVSKWHSLPVKTDTCDSAWVIVWMLYPILYTLFLVLVPVGHTIEWKTLTYVLQLSPLIAPNVQVVTFSGLFFFSAYSLSQDRARKGWVFFKILWSFSSLPVFIFSETNKKYNFNQDAYLFCGRAAKGENFYVQKLLRHNSQQNANTNTPCFMNSL